MPVYNGAQFICHALDSLLSQNYEEFELIISDNASTDATQKICMEYANRDERIRYYRNPTNMGASWNFNRVFDLSSGEYFMWASCDDYWDSKYIDTCLQTLKTSKTILLAGTICRSIDSDTNQLRFVDKGFSTIGLNSGQSFIRYKSIIHSGNHIGGIFYGLYKKDILSKVMPMRKVIATDHLLLAELSLLGEIITIQKPLLVKRWGGASTNHRNNARALGIENRFYIYFPYLVREIILQKIIFQNDGLSLANIFGLACWSLQNYIKNFFIKLFKRVRRRWRSAMRRALGSTKKIWRQIMVSRFLDKVRAYKKLSRRDTKIRKYIKSGRKPWKEGYKEYKEKILSDILRNQNILDLFSNNKSLPDKYGFRIDERAVEIPWVISRLDFAESVLLDAGSALNFKYILDNSIMKRKRVVIYTLSPEKSGVKQSNISYVYGDLRDTMIKSKYFDEIVCISTLEHIGMNNEFLYSNDSQFNECKPDDYKDVIQEFSRLLKIGGRLFVTVPYGRYENIRWLQQFDHKMIEIVINVFGGSTYNVTYYKYFDNGWQLADADACNDCLYFNIHNRSDYEADYVAAARAVACIEMVK